MIRKYHHLIKIPTFEERFKYLKLHGRVGETTFGVDRYMNQNFYTSQRWRIVRRQVIIRDMGCDLGLEGYEIHGKIMIHHMNPVTIEEIEEMDDILYNPEYLICTSFDTHQAIHYGDPNLLPRGAVVERKPGDTKLW